MIVFENTHNPVLPLSVHVPDAEGHVMPDGKLYLYGSYDLHDNQYCSSEYHVVSTPDLKRWTIHDTALDGKDIPWFADLDAPHSPGLDVEHPTPFLLEIIRREKEAQEKKKDKPEEPLDSPAVPLLFAPDCIEKDGKYYLYFCMADDSEGVAVSQHPEGPFVDPVRFSIGGIDPAIFIDTDGQAYYYWGQLRSHGVKLNPDMISIDPTAIVDNLVTEERHFFHEGSSMRRIGDTYYYVFADMERGKPTALGYATGSSPLGPFAYRGIIIDNDGCDPESWNNHGSIECVNGQWYVFYHRSSRNTKYHRRLCVETIQILEDGSIPEVKMTSQGVGEPFAPGETIYGYQACGLTGHCFIGPDPVCEESLQVIHDQDSATFRYVRSQMPFTGLSVQAEGSGTIHILMNEREAGSIVIRNGKQETPDQGCIQASAGEYELRLRFENPEHLMIRTLVLR